MSGKADRHAVRCPPVRILPRVFALVELGLPERSFADEQGLQRRQPTVVIALRGDPRICAGNALQLAAQRMGPFRPGEAALPGSEHRDGERASLPRLRECHALSVWQ